MLKRATSLTSLVRPRTSVLRTAAVRSFADESTRAVERQQYPDRQRGMRGRRRENFGMDPFDAMNRMLSPRRGFDFDFDMPFFRDLIPFEEQFGGREQWLPKVNVSETDKAISVHAELPGVKKDDIKVEVKNDTLLIKGEKKFQKKEEDKDRKFTRVESSYGFFERAIPLPEGVDSSKVAAKFNEGVLELEIPKPEGSAKTTTIDIA